MRSRSLAVGAIAALATGVLGPACTPKNPGPAGGARLPLEGRILIAAERTQESFGFGAIYTLPKGTIQDLPRGGSQFLEGAAWTSRGSLYELVAFGRFKGTQLVRVDPRGRAVPVGASMPFSAQLLGLAGGRAFALVQLAPGPGIFQLSSGESLWELDLAHAGRWRQMSGASVAAISPDGLSIALSPKGGRMVQEVPVAGGAIRTLLDLRRMARLRFLGITDPRVAGLAWGRDGVAFGVRNGPPEAGTPPSALVVLSPGGRVRVVALGDASVTDLAWQPGGDSLAFADCYPPQGCQGFGFGSPQSDLRILDQKTGAVRQVAASTDMLAGIVWSPDGRFLATQWRAGELLFVDPVTDATERRVAQAVPLEWRS